MPDMRRVRDMRWRRLFSYTRPYWGRLSLAIVAMVGASAAGLAMPLVSGQLLNAIALGEGVSYLNIVALLMIGLIVVQIICGVIQTYLLSFVGERVVADLRRQVYEHLQSLSLTFFNDRRVGEITSRVTNDVTIIQTTTTSSVASFLQNILQFIGALTLMCVVSWRLTGLVLILTPVIIGLGTIYGRRLRRASTDVQDKLAHASSILEETMSGVRIVQSFARERYEARRFGGAIEETFTSAMRRTWLRTAFEPVLSALAFGGLVLVLWVGGRMVLSGEMSPGDLLTLLFYGATIGGAMGGFTSIFSQLQQALGATERVFELLDTQSDIQDRPGAVELPVLKGEVVFSDVTFGYRPDGPPVLNNVSLNVQPGERLALVGPSGSGKSTIVNLIPRFYDVRTGRVTVDGYDVRDVQLRSLREQIGIVPQETLLFNGTVRDNILYGSRNDRAGMPVASDDEVIAAAQAANAHEFIQRLPQTYNTLVGERGVKLSGGQRQRIAIARALLKDPRILILDEATSSLDSESEGLVQQALERLMEGRTTLVIAHRLSTVRRVNRIAVIVEGHVVERGTHEELMQQNGVYARLYALQMRE